MTEKKIITFYQIHSVDAWGEALLINRLFEKLVLRSECLSIYQDFCRCQNYCSWIETKFVSSYLSESRPQCSVLDMK